MNVKPLTPASVQQWQKTVVKVVYRIPIPPSELIPMRVWDFYPKVKK